MSESEPLGFDFSGGCLCLDFTNTLTDRLSVPTELLKGYTDLVAWAEQAQVLNEGEQAQLLRLAREQPEEATRWLSVARQARELIFKILNTLADGHSPGESNLQTFNQMLGEAMAYARLAPDETGFCWTWAQDQNRLERPLWFVVRSAADLLTSPDLSNVRACASEDCGWLFLDTSKNHTRRWCAMKSCGNRAKARRHYERQREK